MKRSALDKAGLTIAVLAMGVLPALATLPASATAAPPMTAGTATGVTVVTAGYPGRALSARVSTAARALTGRGSAPAMVRQIRAGGHYLENHTSTHPSLTRISNAAVLKQIAGGMTPNTSPRLLRPPYGDGAYSYRLYSLAKQKGYRLCYWAVDTHDWARVSASVIFHKVVHGDRGTPPARAGDPILMHLSNTQTRYALPGIIKALRAKRLTFEKLRSATG